MGSATEIIILSPENNAIHTPPPRAVSTKSSLLCGASSSPMPSPSDLFRPPSRSRFFATSDHDCSKTKDVPTEKRTATDSNAAPPENKPVRKGRKTKTGAQAELCDLDQALLGNKENVATKPKRTRKKQADTGNGGEKLNNKTLTGKVAKAGSKKSKVSAAKPVDGQPSPEPTRELSVGKEDAHGCEGEDLQLEPAIKRRLDWTPSKEPVQPVIELEAKDGAVGGQTGLGTLLSGFEYDGVIAASDRFQLLADAGPTKRRRIELVDSRLLPLKPKASDNDAHSNGKQGSQPSAASKPKKKPAPRAKRLTTLTARVTASYQQASTACSDTADQEASCTAEKQSVVKFKSRKTKKKADENKGFKVPRTILLSPEAAIKSLDQQDLVFGTCSQLERADSPTLLEDTQIAIQVLEKEVSSAPTSHLNRYPRLTGPSTALSRLATPRNLWSVAARDAEGSLVDVEIVNLIDTPEVPKAIASINDEDNQKDDQPIEVNSGDNGGDVLPLQTTHTVHDESIQSKPTQSFLDVEEIQDSEDELPSPTHLFTLPRPEKKKELPTSTIPSSPTPKPPSTPRQRQKRQTKEPLPTIPLTAKTPSSPSKLPNLNDQITKAVRAQPRMKPAAARKGLTWHEKILMYDPIFLEDFTAWLNTEGLSLVDEDREVGAGFVRDWCESKGICCCYKVKKAGRHF
ncbi:Slx4 endonuclease-domain-containing protein [Aspergillus spectabilis]